jgi:hypothetical protein
VRHWLKFSSECSSRDPGPRLHPSQTLNVCSVPTAITLPSALNATLEDQPICGNAEMVFAVLAAIFHRIIRPV